MESYSILNDFGGISPNLTQLHTEIENETNITTSFNGLTSYEDDIKVFFTSSISAPEKTYLDAVISNHVSSYTVITDYNQKIISRLDYIKNSVYRRIAKPFIFPGLTYGKATCISRMDSDVTSYNIKIQDITNNLIVLETTLSNTDESSQDLGILSNLSSEPWVIEIYAKKTGGSKKSKIYLESLNIEYN